MKGSSGNMSVTLLLLNVKLISVQAWNREESGCWEKQLQGSRPDPGGGGMEGPCLHCVSPAPCPPRHLPVSVRKKLAPPCGKGRPIARNIPKVQKYPGNLAQIASKKSRLGKCFFIPSLAIECLNILKGSRPPPSAAASLPGNLPDNPKLLHWGLSHSRLDRNIYGTAGKCQSTFPSPWSCKILLVEQEEEVESTLGASKREGEREEVGQRGGSFLSPNHPGSPP